MGRSLVLAGIGIGVIVLVALVASTLWSPGGKQSTNTSQSTVRYSDILTVRTRVLQYITYLTDQNGPAVAGFWSFDARINWTGANEPWQGSFPPDGSTSRLTQFLTQADSFSANYSSYSVTPSGPDRINATFHLDIRETSTVTGPTDSSINVSQSWYDYDGNWLIQTDTWNFVIWHVTPPTMS